MLQVADHFEVKGVADNDVLIKGVVNLVERQAVQGDHVIVVWQAGYQSSNRRLYDVVAAAGVDIEDAVVVIVLDVVVGDGLRVVVVVKDVVG